ncbi:unnamed protein product [Brugia pahangi]|uniref:ShKT domain-containing protein n=1 Tax=Brugia pahangi TaxID=6280 RepID=A0A0N4TKH3_BRUPA|nr:unnamed protein product [Brugia pahangi]
MFSTFTVVLACIVFIVGKGEAFSDYACVDEEEEGGVNCTQIKLEKKCAPETAFETGAIFCQKTCDLCDVDIDIDVGTGKDRPSLAE